MSGQLLSKRTYYLIGHNAYGAETSQNIKRYAQNWADLEWAHAKLVNDGEALDSASRMRKLADSLDQNITMEPVIMLDDSDPAFHSKLLALRRMCREMPEFEAVFGEALQPLITEHVL